MNMIEKVARAICRSMESDPDEHWRVYEDEARAAIEVVRDEVQAFLDWDEESVVDCLTEQMQAK